MLIRYFQHDGRQGLPECIIKPRAGGELWDSDRCKVHFSCVLQMRAIEGWISGHTHLKCDSHVLGFEMMTSKDAVPVLGCSLRCCPSKHWQLLCKGFCSSTREVHNKHGCWCIYGGRKLGNSFSERHSFCIGVLGTLSKFRPAGKLFVLAMLLEVTLLLLFGNVLQLLAQRKSWETSESYNLNECSNMMPELGGFRSRCALFYIEELSNLVSIPAVLPTVEHLAAEDLLSCWWRPKTELKESGYWTLNC